MSTITTRSGKGSPLTHDEVDDNFTNLNTDKLEDITGESVGDLVDVDITTVAPTLNDALVWDGTNFVPGAVETGDPTKVVAAVKNVTAGTLAKGTPVHITGATGNTFHVIAARADTPSAMPASGILAQQLTANSDGNMIISGFINGVDTSLFSAGDEIYVAATGGYDNAPPAGESNLIQKLGVVSVVDASNGSGLIQGAGRTNATPNLDNDQFFLGNASNQAVATDFTAAVEARSINALSDDLTPTLSGTLNVNNFNIENLGSNKYMTLGNNPNLVPATHAHGAWRGSSLAGFTGATRLFYNGDVSTTSLGGSISTSNGRIINNYQATTLDLNSNSLTSTGIMRGLNSLWVQAPEIQNTGGTASTLAQNRNVFVQGAWLSGSNITVDETTGVYINQYYEGDDATGTITNAYGMYINDGGSSGPTVTNKYSIYSNGANNPMYHAGPVTIGAFTLPNTDGAAGQVLTTDGLGNVTWTTVSGGSGSFSGDLAGATLEDTVNATIRMDDVVDIYTDAAHNGKPGSLRINENDYVDGASIVIQKANNAGVDGGYMQIRKLTGAVTGAYPRLVNIFDTSDVPVGSTTTPTQSMLQLMRRVYYNTYFNSWENWTQTVYEYGLNGSFNINGGNGYVGTSNQKMNWGVPMDFQMNGTAGFAFNTGDTAVYSILTGAGAITNSVSIEINTGGQPTQFNALADQAWLDTGVGVYHPRIDPFYAYGTNWKLTMRFAMPSWAAQTSVTVDKAFPPVGQIVSQFGFVYPSYANAPTWANPGARQITMTRPASGRNLYEYTFECVNGALFVRDWRLDNIA